MASMVSLRTARQGGVAEFARPFKVFPGDLEGFLKQLGE
jgi:hypothetical protein